MTTATATTTPTTPAAPAQERVGSPLGTFGALIVRDLYVTARELPSFLVQVVLQPFFTLFVFGTVLSQLGLVAPGFTRILLPGVVAMTVFITAIQNTALPLVVDFAATREIEDRLLAPISTFTVALEKVVFGAARGLAAGVIMVPVGFGLLSGVSWPATALPAALVIGILAALTGAALGLLLATSVSPKYINVMFAASLMPLMFTGAAQFPFFGLGGLKWFQVVVAINPLTYVSEAMRWLLVPELRSISIWIDLPVLVAWFVVLLIAGAAGFRRRATD
jgi:ABC-2 type transport system permease protein